jgi:phthiocerol/phenolphthiocerol synthesis type-I polyketide synthase E
MNTTNRKKDIAVIGMSGVFPKSKNLSVFWENLLKGQELVHFYDPQEIDESLLEIPNYVPVGSFLENSDSFDYKFFGYTKEEALLMDPQIRVMHEQVYASLDNAGYVNKLGEHTIGLYLAASDNFNWRLLEMFYNEGKVSKFLAQRLSNKEFISTLISYKLGLKGPSFFIDTACSGSLSNIHLACRSLLLRECNMAVSGGVSIQSTETKGYFFEDGLIASKDGHCRAFDEKSSGTIWGEGAGAVVLKRFEDAVKDNDHIYAVIKATAVNNDGNRKVGYTAPSVEGQSECIKMTHKIAGVLPESIHYIEAHGTGTNLGDPIEIEALNKAFNYNTNHKCAIGSVKTNMGHLDAAAGISGFIKTCLSVYHKMIPPSLHFTTPNPEINFKDGPFYVNKTLQQWKRNDIFRVGISGFGIGGTNCHAIVEEFSIAKKHQDKKPYHLFVLSAKTTKALASYKENLIAFLQTHKDVPAMQLCYSINSKAQNFPCKDFIVFKDYEDAIEQLRLPFDGVSSKKYKNIVFMFPGQGTQYIQMAKELYTEIPYFKRIMDRGFPMLKEETKIDFKAIVGYTENDNISDSLIHNTQYTQPLLFMVEYALAETLINFGISPTVMIGHSLGEYTAACISGVFSFEQGLKIVCERAALMSSMKPGAMIAINAKAESILALTSDHLSVAAVNIPDTCVLSGETEAVERLASTLDELSIRHTVLRTSHAFHSYMMDDMLKPFEKTLESIPLETPKIPFISNLTGKIISQEVTATSYWSKHVRNTVRFHDGMQELLQNWSPKESIFIEVGPGRIGLNFLNKITSESYLGISTIQSAKEVQNDYKLFLKRLGVLWKVGKAIDLANLYEENIQKIPTPTYSFDTLKLPSRVDPFRVLQGKISDKMDIPQLMTTISNLIFFDNAEEIEADQTEASENYRINLTTHYIPPEGEIQTKLCTIWEDFLGKEKIGIEDNFFELGGDSLKALSILNTIKKEFNYEMKVNELYENLNIKSTSANIKIHNRLKRINKKVVSNNKMKI